MVSYLGPDGKQNRRSTKVPVAGGLYKGEKLSPKQAEKRALLVGAEIAKADFDEHVSHNNVTVRAHLNEYARRAARHLSEKSARTNRSSFDRFMKWLGPRADMPLRFLTKGDAKMYLEDRRVNVRCNTVIREACCFKVAWEDAVDKDIVPKNIWRGITIPRDKGEEILRSEAFTMDEVRYMIANFPPEWSSAIRCSFESFGQRLGDIRRLRWKQFDWEKGVIRFVTGKCDRVMEQPMRPGFLEWVKARWEAEGCPKDGFLHPHLARTTTSISSEFTLLMEQHGIGERQEYCEGDRKAHRTKTFHSVRRAAATQIHATGISETMAMKLVGHNSSAVHAVYVKPDTEILRNLAAQIPDIGV